MYQKSTKDPSKMAEYSLADDVDNKGTGQVQNIHTTLGCDRRKVRKAYANRNVRALIEAHQKVPGSAESKESSAARYIKSIVFGGLDGIITTFSVLCAGIGAGMSTKDIIIMGVANLFADAISMGIGDALSEKAEKDLIDAELARERWEFDENPNGEIEEMMQAYKNHGISEDDAHSILTCMAKYKDFFVRHMMIMELGLYTTDDSDEPSPWLLGLATFCSFVAFGSIPVIAYVLFSWVKLSINYLFLMCVLSAAISTFSLGMLKGKLEDSSMFLAGALMTMNGGAAAMVSYAIGFGLGQALPG